MTQLHLPAGSARNDGYTLAIDPTSANWRFCGLRIAELDAGEARRFATGSDEYAVLPLAGSCVVEVEGERFVLSGRPDPFSRVTDFAYVGRDSDVRLVSAEGARVALPFANARRRLPARYAPAESVPVEIRGAGAATRQLNNFMAPESFDADRLTCVEVLTPEGNTSSYPPHKHDADEPADGQAVLEEIYYFEVRGDHGFGMHRTYTTDGRIDATVTVRSGDAFLIPRGYHGPCVALPGHDLYTLTVLAGPAETRSLAYHDDDRHAWIRASWDGVASDPRLPMCGAGGPRASSVTSH